MKPVRIVILLFVSMSLWAQDEPTIESILNAFQDKNLTQAEELLRHYSSPLSANDLARFESIIKQHSPQGNWISFLTVLSDKADADGDFLFFIAQAMWRSGDVDRALVMSGKAMDASPDDLGLLYRCAAIAKTLGKLDEAKQRIEMVLAKDEHYADALFLSASIMVEQGSNEQAKQVLQRVIKDNPNHFRSLYELGKLETRLGNNEESVNHLNKAIEVYPFFREAYSAMRVPLSRLKKPEEFKRLQNQIRHMQQWNPDQYNQLRYWYENAFTIGKNERQILIQELLGLQQYDHALKYLTQLRQQKMTTDSQHMLLAQLHFQQKNLVNTLEILKEIRDETVLSSETYLGVKAWTFLGLGKLDQSNELYENYKTKFASSPNFQALGNAIETEKLKQQTSDELYGSNTGFQFEDQSDEAGLSSFQHRMGHPDKRWIIDAMGSGVAVADYDNDGDDDIYFVNGKLGLDDNDPQWKNRLFRNDDGTFTDVTDESGTGDLGWGMCAVFGDINNDGWLDLFVGNYGANHLYVNLGDGTFKNHTNAAGLEHDGYAAAAVFGDVDLDGDLDLFVGNYVAFDPEQHSELRDSYHGLEVMNGPLGLNHQNDLIYLNNGDGTFHDASEKSEINVSEGRAMGAVFFDVEPDGDLDLYVANDSSYNHLLINDGKGVFEDQSFVSGTAVNESGREGASMGVAAGDYDNDGLVDLYVTAYEQEADVLYHNKNENLFQDISAQMQLKTPSYWLTTWGTGFCDFDADGWLDIYTVNGHTYPQVEELENDRTYAQGISFYKNQKGKAFDVEKVSFNSFKTLAGRGSAILDYDNDGDMDIVINCIDDHPRLLENRTTQGNWLKVKLEGTSAQTFGVRVVVRSGDLEFTRFIDGGSSYLSQNSHILHFGLGTIDKIDELKIYWMHKKTKNYTDLEINQTFTAPF